MAPPVATGAAAEPGGVKTIGLNGLAVPGLLASATAPAELPPNGNAALDAAEGPAAPKVNCPEDTIPAEDAVGAPEDTTGAPNSGADAAAAPLDT